MSDLSLNQLSMGVEAFRAEVNALKNELSDVRRQAAIANESVQLLLAQFGCPKSVGESVLTVAHEKVKIL